MYAQQPTHDVFSRTERLEAEIVTVKELLKEAIDYNDVLGVSTYESRLDAIELEQKDLALRTTMRVNQYSL